MVNKAPNPMFTLKGEEEPKAAPDDRSFRAFTEMVEKSIALNKQKSKGAKDVRREQRVEKQKDMGKQLKRAQRYLGVLPKKEKGK
jgi:hypothetical protein